MIAHRLVPALAALVAVVASVELPAPSGAADGEAAFVVGVDSPTVKVGHPAVIVATITPRNGYRITEYYRHRIVNLTSIDDGVDVTRRVVRGSVKEDGTVVFRIEVQPKTVGAHIVAGVFRFSINNGTQLDIKAAPFEATVTVTE
jgi:hypothetical protein